MKWKTWWPGQSLGIVRKNHSATELRYSLPPILEVRDVLKVPLRGLFGSVQNASEVPKGKDLLGNEQLRRLEGFLVGVDDREIVRDRPQHWHLHPRLPIRCSCQGRGHEDLAKRIQNKHSKPIFMRSLPFFMFPVILVYSLYGYKRVSFNLFFPKASCLAIRFQCSSTLQLFNSSTAKKGWTSRSATRQRIHSGALPGPRRSSFLVLSVERRVCGFASHCHWLKISATIQPYLGSAFFFGIFAFGSLVKGTIYIYIDLELIQPV